MMFVAVFRLCVFLPYISGLIMPLTKSDGSPDLTSLLGHLTLLEQTVEYLHKDTNNLQIDLKATNERLQLTQADLSITRQELQTSRTDLQVTRTDLQVTKDKLQHTQNDLQITKNDLQAAQTDLLTYKGLQQSSAAEMSTLKTDITGLRSELGLTKSQVEKIGREFLPLNSNFNDSVLVSLNGSVTANQGAIKAIELEVQSVHDDLNITAHTISEVQSDINSFKRNVSSALHNVTEECLALKSDSNLISSLQSNITAIDTKLTILNIKVYEVQSETRQLAANTSSVVQQLKNMDTHSLKALAQDTSAQLKQLEKNVNSTNVSIESQLKQLTTGVNSSSASIHNVQQDLLSLQSDLNTTREDITVTNSEVHALNSKLSDVRKLSAETKQALAQLVKTQASKTTAVAFQAYVSTNKNVTSLHPIVYDIIIYHSGSVYNNTTGKFKAPVSGTYMFWTELIVHTFSYTPAASIKKSGKTIGSGSFASGGDFVISTTCVSHLQKGEEVWVQFEKVLKDAWGGFYSATVLVVSNRDDQWPKSFFGGALLTAD